jgi:biopolymer transport protein ExbB
METDMLKRSRTAAVMASLLIGAAAGAPQIAFAQPGPASAAVQTFAAVAAPVPAPAPTALPALESTEKVANPYGLEALWKGGDFVARGTLLILVIMSMGSWYIMVSKLVEQARVLRRARLANARFWSAQDYPQVYR